MPKASTIHVDKTLENVSVAYKSEGLIASRLSPGVPVQHESDRYFVYSKDSLSVPDTIRANGAAANESTFNLSTASYALTEHALKDIVTERDRNNADKAIKLDVDTTEYLTEKILLRREKALATLVHTAANWANITSLTSTFAWSANTTLSNPISFVDSAASVIAQNSGKLPNVVTMDFRTFQAAKEHQSIVDRIKYTSTDSVTESLLAKLFNVSEVLVARGIENTAKEGLADSMSFIFTDVAFVCYRESSPGLKKPSAFYTFFQSNSGNPFQVRRWMDDERNGEMIEVSSLFQHKPVASDTAYLIVNTVQ